MKTAVDVLFDRMNDDDPRIDLTASLGGLSVNANRLTIQTYLLCGALLAMQRALKQIHGREAEYPLLRNPTVRMLREIALSTLGETNRRLDDLCLGLARLTAVLLMWLGRQSFPQE